MTNFLLSVGFSAPSVRRNYYFLALEGGCINVRQNGDNWEYNFINYDNEDDNNHFIGSAEQVKKLIRWYL